jgi:uncharacterized RDD family membrane protein YckC
VEAEPLPTDVDWRANIGTRLGARLLDGVVVALPVALLLLAFADIDVEAQVLEIPFWVTATTLLIGAGYEVGAIAMWGQTVGKRLLHIQVVDVVTGRPPGLGGAAIRYLVPGVPAALPFSGGALLSLLVYLSAVWSPTRQGWHDRAAGTVVVRTAARQAIQGGWARVDPHAGGPG